MATVKFDEGTKFETSFNLDDDEIVIFARPAKNRTYRLIDEGCLMGLLTIITLGIIRIFKPTKHWLANFVLTNKRLITIPVPPNKKKMVAESFYLTDITKAKALPPKDPKDGELALAMFAVDVKSGAKSSCLYGGEFWFYATVNAKFIANIGKQLVREVGTGLANQFSETNAMIQTQHNKMNAIERGDKYYTVVTAAKTKLEAMDMSGADHVQLRDLLVDLINSCAEAARE
jgi:hypothetical protein